MATLLSDRLALDIPRLALLFLRAFGCLSRAARGSALTERRRGPVSRRGLPRHRNDVAL